MTGTASRFSGTSQIIGGTPRRLLAWACLTASTVVCQAASAPQLSADSVVAGTVSANFVSTQDDAEKEVRAAITEMIEQLEGDGFWDFARHHMPIDDYLLAHRRGGALAAGNTSPPRRALVPLTNWLKELQEYEIEFDKSGLNVRMFPKPGAAPPEPKGLTSPYADLRIAENTSGYGSDLSQAISSALRDLQAKKYDAFMDAMIPPGTTAMMKQDGRWEALQQSLTADSPMIQKMIEDLTDLQEMKAEIDGEVAEFTLPVTATVAVGRGGVQQDVGTRTVRFSLIGGNWRFYEETGKLREEIAAALRRKPPEVEADSDQFVLEKIGSDWRLREIPQAVIRGTRDSR